MGVAIGVDSHKSSFAAAAVDEVGRELKRREFGNNAKGHRQALKWARAIGSDSIFGIEGSGRYGAGLARVLLASGEDVREVPPFLSHRERKRTPSKGKSDLSDAVAIARIVARGEGLVPLVGARLHEDLRLLSDHRDQLVHTRTRLANRVHKDLSIMHPGYEQQIPKLTRKKQLAAAEALLGADGSVRARLARERIEDLFHLDARIAAVTKEIAARVTETGTTLTRLTGISFVLAARILGEIGDPRRLGSKACFAMLNGTAPLEASSGNTRRHRLNRKGNRKLNFVLHRMAIVCCRVDADTKNYMAGKVAEGKSKKEALRCLKRHLSNVVHRQLLADLERGAIAA